MIATSTMPGTLVSLYSPSASSVAAISLSTEFFAPGHERPRRCSGPARRTMMRHSGSPERRRSVTADQYARRPCGRGRMPVDRSSPMSGRHGHPTCWPDEPAVRATPRRRRATTSSPRRRDRATARSSSVDGPVRRSYERTLEPRRRTTLARDDDVPAGRSRGSAGCSRSRCAAVLSRRGDDPVEHQPHQHAVVGAARPARHRARRCVLGLLAAASMSSAFANTLFTQTVNFAADDFGVGDTGSASPAPSCGPASSSPCRSRCSPTGSGGDDGHADRGVGGADRVVPSARSHRTSRCSSPPRRSGGRSASRSTS